MGYRLQEITASVVNERFRFGDVEPFTLIMDGLVQDGSTNGSATDERTRVGDGSRFTSIALKGKSESGSHGVEPAKDFTYRFFGQWREYLNQRTGSKEKQFHWQTFVRATPHGEAGVVKWLSGAPGIGRALARRLWDEFAGDAVIALRTMPEDAASRVKGLSVEVAVKAAEWLETQKATEDCSIELVSLLEGRGFPKSVYKLIVKDFGNLGPTAIKSNPYLLMRYRGCGFKRSDALYLELGHNPAALKRQALCAWHAVATKTDGDTWHYKDTITHALYGSIGGAEVRSEKAISLASRGDLICVQRTNGVQGEMDWDGDCTWIAESRKARNEIALAELAWQAASRDLRWPEFDPGDMTQHQIDAVRSIVGTPEKGNGFCILGGGPGTGKTFCAAQLIKSCGEKYGYAQIAACAPTGKAAVRLTEAMASYKIPLRATTIHSLLRVKAVEGGWHFEHGADSTLPYKVIVVDECSMIDVDLARSLFAAIDPDTLVLFIGDVRQLPPVGHGAPLRDFISAGLPYAELTEIRRNSGEIVEACDAMRRGVRFSTHGNLTNISASDADEQKDAMLEAIRGEANRFNLHPVWDVQVVVAVNKKSELSRRDLNKLLQSQLNPSPAVPGTPFRQGDKIVSTQNSYFPMIEQHRLPADDSEPMDMTDEQIQINSDGKVYVANGEIGEVIAVERNFMHVRLTAPRRMIVIPRGEVDVNEESSGGEESAVDTGCTWDLGYALSVHKAQGSEWPVVIVMIDGSGAAKRICDRSWYYTAISRARRQCVLIGQIGEVFTACRRESISRRKTFLAERIRNRSQLF